MLCRSSIALWAASEAAGTGRAVHHFGQRFDWARRGRFETRTTVKRPPHDTGDGRTREVGGPHEQQGLYEQRNHASAPEPAPAAILERPCCLIAAYRPMTISV